jgi:H+/Cl- antiporter ClcA
MLTIAGGIILGLFGFLLIAWLASKTVEHLSSLDINWGIAVTLAVALLGVIGLFLAYYW